MGRRVDLEEAVRHLLSRRSPRVPHLLEKACDPLPDAKKSSVKREIAMKEFLSGRLALDASALGETSEY